MTAYKHPITHHWIKQTLVPFLLYAFASTLPYPADISDEIQRSIDFALVKPDHPSDGDDVVFERVFMAIMHRHKNLAPDLSIVVDHLEPCAKYLIRRAQLKGPFELLDRTDVGSSAWVEYEWERLSNLVVERGEAEDELRTPVRPPLAATKLSPTDGDLDPRLVHAQPGHFAAANHSGQLTAAENSYYRQQNRNYEQAHLQRQQQSIYSSAAPAQLNVPSYVLPGRGPSHSRTTSVHKSSYSQHQQKIPQQSALPSVYTPQPAINQPTLSVQTNAAAQISGQTQASQPQTLPSSTIITTATLQTYVSKQHAWPQFQPAQFPPAQSKISMQTPQFFSKLPKGAPMLSQMNAQQQPPRLTQTHIPPAQCQPGQQQTSSPGASQQQLGGHQTAQLQDYVPQTYYQSTLPPQPTPPPTVAPNNIPSSDFAHFRGNDWSNAAQQRAREIAAKITAQECDNMAQSIIQRQQSIAQ
ncbi:hypothetical protein E8E12_007205 [Didymella heteroderae]|uniref:Uncharacterized protein n=1 Tax=Didymella heteroderae TaxID=1769908 RepID=A0A9P5BY65_9PLEO|nr:hypothetical protein E8E12_007205 [Didymella heteroderae]